MKLQLFDVIGTIFSMLEVWDWSNWIHLSILGYFIVGCVPQFVLLRQKWKPWIISLILVVLIVLCETAGVLIVGENGMIFGIFEMFFISCLFGAAAGATAFIFWETVKKKD